MTYRSPKSGCLAAALLLLAALAFFLLLQPPGSSLAQWMSAYLPLERDDYKPYPTSTDPADFYGRVYAKTRVEPVRSKPAADASQASAQVGFPVRLPSYPLEGARSAPAIITVSSPAYQVYVNLDAARSLLASRGIPVDALPAEPQSFRVQVDLPPSAVTSQGADPTFITFIQSASPAYTPPSDIDPALLDELNRLGWQYLGLTPEQAAGISARLNWAWFVTLPPADTTSASYTSVQGQPAVALQGGNHQALLWEKDGVLYGIYSNLPAAELSKIAASLE
jgi:hypothetical protein